jgi:mannan endo-1,4-beta-mannosidase
VAGHRLQADLEREMGRLASGRIMALGVSGLVLLGAIGAAQARPLDGATSGALRIKITAPSNGQTLSGVVGWQVQVLAGRPNQVTFYVDGTQTALQAAAPYAFSFDSTTLGDGTHTLTVVATAGPATTSDTVSVTVGNSHHKKHPPSNTAVPTISGQAQVGQTLTASTGSWSGTTPMTYAYQWLRCDSAGANCSAVTGATSSSYTIVSGDSGSTLRVSVTATNSDGSASAQSAATSQVGSSQPPQAPQNTVLPTISGAAQVGQTLTGSPGSWSGTQPISFAYQWNRCDSSGANCSNIAGATAVSYTTVSADQGSTLRFAVTASNSAGSASARSLAAGPVTAPSAQELYWGAWIGSQFTGTEAPWDMTAVADFEKLSGKPVSLINFSSPWQNCYSNPCTSYKFDTTAFNNVRNHGAIPFFSWGSDSLPFSLNEPNLSLGTIIAGNWDSYITTWATAAKTWGHPFFLRFNWEMNGNWFPWSEGVNGNTAGQYVQSWRHVHDIFTSVGATNVTWVWAPNIDPNNSHTSISSLYPGDSYVDWTGLDGYNWDSPWMTFDQLYSSTYQKLVGSVAPGKPVVVAEQSSTEKGGSKASWIKDMLTNVPQKYPQVKALLWFEKYDSGMDWPIETSSSATAAFAAAIASSAYATNQFGSLGGGPIQPLS